MRTERVVTISTDSSRRGKSSARALTKVHCSSASICPAASRARSSNGSEMSTRITLPVGPSLFSAPKATKPSPAPTSRRVMPSFTRAFSRRLSRSRFRTSRAPSVSLPLAKRVCTCHFDHLSFLGVSPACMTCSCDGEHIQDLQPVLSQLERTLGIICWGSLSEFPDALGLGHPFHRIPASIKTSNRLGPVIQQGVHKGILDQRVWQNNLG